MYAPAPAVAERIGPTAAAVEAVDGDRCVLYAGADSLDDLGLYVARLGFAFDVHEPRELVERVHAMAAGLARVRYVPAPT
jgi:hypothetical protein